MIRITPDDKNKILVLYYKSSLSANANKSGYILISEIKNIRSHKVISGGGNHSTTDSTYGLPTPTDNDYTFLGLFDKNTSIAHIKSIYPEWFV